VKSERFSSHPEKSNKLIHTNALTLFYKTLSIITIIKGRFGYDFMLPILTNLRLAIKAKKVAIKATKIVYKRVPFFIISSVVFLPQTESLKKPYISMV
ncbi:hypothetical protein, partial [Streptomyces sp. NPDC002159]